MSARRSFRSRAGRIAGKTLLLAAAAAAAGIGGAIGHKYISERQTAAVERQESVIRKNLRPSDLHEARMRAARLPRFSKLFVDFDDIVYEIAAERPEKMAKRLEEVQRAGGELLPAEQNDELSRLPLREIREIMGNHLRGGLEKKDVLQWEQQLRQLKKTQLAYLEGLEARSPARVREKIKRIYAWLSTVGGAGVLGFVIMAWRRARKPLTRAQLTKYAIHSSSSPFVIERSRDGLYEKTAWSNGRHIFVVAREGDPESRGRYILSKITRTYDAKTGKFISIEK